MEMTANAEDLVIDSVDQLHQFLQKQPPHTELRFPAATSYRKNFGVTIICYKPELDAVLLLPYYIRHSHVQPEEKNVIENPHNVAERCLLAEAGLKIVGTSKEIGRTSVPNSHPRRHGKEFVRYVMLALDVKGTLRAETISEKNGSPIYVKTWLLRSIFEKKRFVDHKPRSHRQLYAYNFFNAYLYGNTGEPW